MVGVQGDVEMNHMIKHASRLLHSASPRRGREPAPQLTDNHPNGLPRLHVLTRCYRAHGVINKSTMSESPPLGTTESRNTLTRPEDYQPLATVLGNIREVYQEAFALQACSMPTSFPNGCSKIRYWKSMDSILRQQLVMAIVL